MPHRTGMGQDNLTREVLATTFEKALNGYEGTVSDQATRAMAADYMEATQSPEFHEFRQKNELALDEALTRVFVAALGEHIEDLDLTEATEEYLNHVRGEDGEALRELLLALHCGAV